jgi:hypothetical protein
MNPVIINCIFLYLLVILFSLLQTRFKLITDSPLTFFLLLFLTPLIIYGKAASRGIDTWTELTGFEIFGYTLIWSFINARFLVPKINEGYILAYTLFHWYLLADTISMKGFNYWMIFVVAISVVPTILVIKASFEHKILSQTEKTVLYYWFLFTVIFTYIDQAALKIITPIIALETVDFASTAYVCFTAVQLYFISTTFSLLFVGIPLFHMDKNRGWSEAVRECAEIRKHKLDNYIEYQISLTATLSIIAVSGLLFYLDYKFNFRQYLIAFYTLAFPLLFFYFKWTPSMNMTETRGKWTKRQ